MTSFLIGLVFFILGGIIGAKIVASVLKENLSEAFRSRARDRVMILTILRRELANVLIWHDPDRFVKIYNDTHSEISSYENLKNEDIKGKLSTLCSKYPYYSDFDLLEIRDYIQYVDAFDWINWEDISEHYKNLIYFIALSNIDNPEWGETNINTISSGDLLHIDKYVQEIKDSKLLFQIEIAMELYYASQQCAECKSYFFENRDFKVEKIPHVAESRWGITLKVANEFGIYSSFYGEKTHTSIYRSNSEFNSEEIIDPSYGIIDNLKKSSGISSINGRF